MRICTVEGCNEKHRSKGYCKRHYEQFRILGKIVPTRFDPTKIIEIDEKTIGIVLRDNNGEQRAIALVDADKRHVVEKHKWFVNDQGYVGTNLNGTTRKLHSFILESKDGIDHINHDTLDNRVQNLRPCSHSQNMMNRKIFKKNKHGVTGVYLYRGRRWYSVIKANKKLYHLGYFDTKDDAIRARVQAEIKYFGEFAPQVDKYKHLLEGVAI